uniref:Envelope fusion protein n=1 Tax=Homalodisca liturata TaxID=320908 RepID=A0A1B6J597_9HEMI
MSSITFVTGLMIITLVKAAEMSQGVVFRKLEDSVISGDEWRIVLDFDLVEILDELIPLKERCVELEQFKNISVNVWDEDFEFEYIRVKEGIEQYESDITDLLKLLPPVGHSRNKRGLINAGGYALKWLFGVPTSEDLEHVNTKVDELKLISGTVVSSSHTQITLMKDINSRIVSNTKAIHEIMIKLSTANDRLITSLTNFNEQNIMMHQSLAKHMAITTMLRHLGQTVDEAKLRVVEFRQALELIYSGKISSKLLNPHDFTKVLNKIEKSIPSHLKLIVPVNDEDIFLYYDLCTAQALANPASIRLIVTVPLSSIDRQFETYKIEVIPLYQPRLRHWLVWKIEHDYLLISKDRQYYVPLTSDEYVQCRHSYVKICPNSISVLHHTVDGCIYSLFMGLSSVTQKCNRVLTENVNSPFWLQNGNDWIYSVAEPYKVILNCFRNIEDDTSVIKTDIVKDYLEVVVNTSGIIKQISRCDIFGKSGKIFSRIRGNIVYKRNITHLHIPKINILQPNETALILLNNNLTFETLKDIKKNLIDDHIEIGLNSLLQGSNINRPVVISVNKNYNFIVMYVVVSLNCVLLVVFICHRRIRRLCTTSRQQRQTQSTSGPDQSQLTVRVEEGTPLAEIIHEASFVRMNPPHD